METDFSKPCFSNFEFSLKVGFISIFSDWIIILRSIWHYFIKLIITVSEIQAFKWQVWDKKKKTKTKTKKENMSLMWPEWQIVSSIFNSVHFSRNFIFCRLFCFLIILNFILRISFLLKNTSIYTNFKQNQIHLNNSKWRMVPFPLLLINDVIMKYWIGVRSVAWEFEGVHTGRKAKGGSN